jgi:hypothetical protein
MRTMSVALALLLVGPSAYAQWATDSYCRINPAAIGCPPPIRVQVVPPDDGLSPGIGALVRTLQSGYQARREQQRLDQEERRLSLEEERLWQSHAPSAPTPTTAPAPVLPAALLTPDLLLQFKAFDYANPDWEQYGSKMVAYASKLKPGDQTDATEYLTLLYRLAKMDAKEALATPAVKP